MEGRALVDTLTVALDRRTSQISKIMSDGYYDKVKIVLSTTSFADSSL